jgi:hypothetical protein
MSSARATWGEDDVATRTAADAARPKTDSMAILRLASTPSLRLIDSPDDGDRSGVIITTWKASDDRAIAAHAATTKRQAVLLDGDTDFISAGMTSPASYGLRRESTRDGRRSDPWRFSLIHDHDPPCCHRRTCHSGSYHVLLLANAGSSHFMVGPARASWIPQVERFEGWGVGSFSEFYRWHCLRVHIKRHKHKLTHNPNLSLRKTRLRARKGSRFDADHRAALRPWLDEGRQTSSSSLAWKTKGEREKGL